MKQYKYYAVAVGKPRGIFTSWSKAKKAINGVKSAKWKGFNSKKEAENWLRNNGTRKRRQIYCRDTGEVVSSYKAYLNTKHWKRFRKKIYEKYNHRCARCRKEIPLGKGNVHHKTYEHIGHEWIKDVTFLCIDCHKLVHKKTAESKKKKGRHK